MIKDGMFDLGTWKKGSMIRKVWDMLGSKLNISCPRSYGKPVTQPWGDWMFSILIRVWVT